MEMITITSAELQRNFGKYQDEALTRPISITRNGRERIVMLSAEEYRRLKRRWRVVRRVEDLSEAEVEALAKTEMSDKYAYLDEELKE